MAILLKGSTDTQLTFAQKLEIYCNEFSEFYERSERLCNAFEDIATHHDSISSYAVRGMKQNARWLKRNMGEIEQKLELLYKELDQNELGS
jgi:hypothetical protein